MIEIRNGEVISVTPELAKQLLATNIENNRSIKPIHVNEIAADITNGLWRENVPNNSIVLAKRKTASGNSYALMDGQHRLMAIVQCGIPIKLKFEIAKEDAFPFIDLGMKRTAADMLATKGIKRASHIATLSKMVYAARYGDMPLASVIQAKTAGRTLTTDA